MANRQQRLRADAHLGVGWEFPPRFDAVLQSAATVDGEESIRQSLRMLFATATGERVLAPNYGSDIHAVAFAAVDETTMGELEELVTRAIRNNEPRIELLHVVALPASERSRIDVSIEYIVRQTNSRTNQVYPFYLSEGVPSLMRNDTST